MAGSLTPQYPGRTIVCGERIESTEMKAEIPYEERIREYSRDGLKDALHHVDREKHPDRYELLQQELGRRVGRGRRISWPRSLGWMMDARDRNAQRRRQRIRYDRVVNPMLAVMSFALFLAGVGVVFQRGGLLWGVAYIVVFGISGVLATRWAIRSWKTKIH